MRAQALKALQAGRFIKLEAEGLAGLRTLLRKGMSFEGLRAEGLQGVRGVRLKIAFKPEGFKAEGLQGLRA